MQVIDVCCRWPGSAHDATIFANSALCEKLDNGIYGSDSALLGDSAYAPKYYICKPLRNPVTNAEQRYQRAQISSRNVGERTFGLLKRRFPCLQFGMHYRLNKVQDIVVACCILHNMVRMELGLNMTDPIEENEIDVQIGIGAQLARVNENRPAVRIQDFLIDSHFA